MQRKAADIGAPPLHQALITPTSQKEREREAGEHSPQIESRTCTIIFQYLAPLVIINGIHHDMIHRPKAFMLEVWRIVAIVCCFCTKKPPN